MRFLIFLLLWIYALIGLVRADVYITTNPKGGVYDISSQPDAVVPSGYTRTDVPNLNMATLPIVPPYQNYNYINGGFTLNTAAVQAYQAAQIATVAAQTATQTAQASAIAKLTDAISKVNTADVLTAQEMKALLPEVNVSIGTTTP